MKSFKRLKRWYPDHEPSITMDDRMITEDLYRNYLKDLLDGRRSQCQQTVGELIDNDIDVKRLYVDLFQRSMYHVGELWENNRISGFPHSYIFSFHPMDSEILVLGHLDTKDVEKMQVDIMLLNQDLGNLNRELHKKNAQLQDALDHVKTLQGIIPICMHCHKIRDERQIWDRLEAYLSEHTSAELSHSICPDCMEKHYPEADDDEAE